jgi:hypothetical protein
MQVSLLFETRNLMKIASALLEKIAPSLQDSSAFYNIVIGELLEFTDQYFNAYQQQYA